MDESNTLFNGLFSGFTIKLDTRCKCLSCQLFFWFDDSVCGIFSWITHGIIHFINKVVCIVFFALFVPIFHMYT